MNIKIRLIIIFCIFSAFSGYSADSSRYWIFFQDKQLNDQLHKGSKSNPTYPEISGRAMRRRAKVLSSSECPDIYDLPLSADYIKTLEDMGAIIIVRSRWLNAVSVRISKEKITDISDLYFVKSVQPVHRHHIQIPLPLPDLMKYSHQQQDSHTLEYGGSFSQLDQINVPETHDLGLSGEGVFIGMIDSGFDTEGYRIFSQTKIMNTYDFYWDDENPANEIGDSTTQHNHGTMTLSVIGGYQEGVLIGSAYGASYALAKSEWISSETQLEEDLWVAALEWMEGLGVDIVSSSLGYGYFDNGFSYSYEDLNGDVCVTTVAADIAAKKGVTVLTSAGNEAMDSWHYILSPADGDSVIAVGAVDWNGEIASFSSGGPTSDGRIKPDVVAMGMGIYSAKPDPDGSIHYVYGSGTSFSCPLAAGVCALILEAHPELTPMQVRNALRETADRADIPDNQYGWGLVDAYQAVFYHGPFLSDLHFSHDLMTSSFQLEFKIQAAKQVSESSVRFYYTPDGSELQTLSVATIVSGLSGQYSVSMPFMPDLDQFAFYVSLNDCEERIYTIPKGAPDILYQFSAEGKERIPVRLRLPESYALLQNFPNPFNNTTKIVFRLPEAENVEIHIFNITGQRIDLLLKEFLPAGEHSIVWYGYDDDGLPVPSGLYLCLLTTREYNETRKMILAR